MGKKRFAKVVNGKSGGGGGWEEGTAARCGDGPAQGYTGSSWQFLSMEHDMGMTSMNVSLPQDLKEYVEKQSEAGYSTPSEYVRELIREDQKRRAKERLDALLLAGLDSGEALRATPAFWDELKREALAKLKKKTRR